MTDSVNPVLTKVEDVLKALAFDTTVDAGLAALFVAAPWLGVPIVRQIVTAMVKWGMNKFYEFARLQTDIGYIRIKNPIMRAAFDAAAIKLQVIALDKGLDSEEFRKERENAKAALARFTNVSR